ncbi:hypothetical protein DBR00_06925 [Pseudomonas sp. HMWF032]|uniref:hypothetical protein n=1 Tax=Pseudomonas sp. HMWF032 TaxID=2056866 RepID=UPI000D3536FE|nr:hypothetical protein [Pseudomonas sp. HMWF032]PTS85502.1 hypothetical protein DBR00_06925 [Pseudomonas sp. HMWF032]PTT82257.1 hypothetical protein DBR41_14345 [Pseudomonas sp. HMWF010]
MNDEEDVEPGNYSYEQRYVAFIDILGFRGHVNELGKNGSHDKLVSLLQALHKIRDSSRRDLLALKAFAFAKDLQATTFSDNIVISGEGDDFQYVLSVTGNLCVELLSQGYLLRGGISSGGLHHSQDIVMGEGLVKAYELESQVAIYPRVIIDDCCLQEALKESTTYPLTKDFDGFYYLDYLAKESNRGFRLFEKSREAIVQTLEHGKPKEKAKARWMARYLNERASIHGIEPIPL